MKPHSALVLIKVDLIEGSQSIKSVLQELSKFSKIDATSSVYKKFLTPSQDDLNAELWAAAKLSTGLFLYEFSDHLLSFQGQLNHRQSSGGRRGRYIITLLSFNDEVNMSPSLTLPAPQLHSEPLILRCAAEAWGEFLHPVVNLTLRDLAKQIDHIKNVEFHSQGRDLI